MNENFLPRIAVLSSPRLLLRAAMLLASALLFVGCATATPDHRRSISSSASLISVAHAASTFRAAGYRALRDLQTPPPHLAATVAIVKPKTANPIATLRIYKTTYWAQREHAPEGPFRDVRYRINNIVLGISTTDGRLLRKPLLRVFAELGKPRRM